jgi:hypothetical protein
MHKNILLFLIVLFGPFFFSNIVIAETDNVSFFKAAKLNDIVLLQRFVDEKGSIDSKSEDGYTALMYAAYYGHTESVKLLLDRGASPCLGDNKDNTALMGAIFKGYPEVVDLLIDRCDVNQRNFEGQTPLMYASLFGREEMAKALLERGADPQLKDASGRDATNLAESQWNQAMVKILKWTKVIKNT